jgi:hypothetical protein
MSGHVTAVKADVSNLDDVYANAGGGSFAPIGGITEEHFDRTLRYERERYVVHRKVRDIRPRFVQLDEM